jgi:hypothetical protein
VPDNNLTCPPGLVLVRPYVATPPSLINGMTLDNGYGTLTQPTNFINNQNVYSDLVLDFVGATIANHSLNRKVGQLCTAADTCTEPVGADQIGIKTTAYVARTPYLCVIDKQFLTGI